MEFKELDPAELARAGFNVFRRSTQGYWRGVELPPWEDLGDVTRNPWIAFVEKLQMRIADSESFRWTLLRAKSELRRRNALEVLDQIDLLHVQGTLGMGVVSGYCIGCDLVWPCETKRLIRAFKNQATVAATAVDGEAGASVLPGGTDDRPAGVQLPYVQEGKRPPA
jgi:hypothetical protein